MAATMDILRTPDLGIPRLTETKAPATQVVTIEAHDVSPSKVSPPETLGKEDPVVLNGTASASAYPKSRIELLDRFIDEPRALRVAVIGGGLAGILAGILLPKKVPKIKLTIYEKNHDVVSATSATETA
jgi:hypothetical protein